MPITKGQLDSFVSSKQPDLVTCLRVLLLLHNAGDAITADEQPIEQLLAGSLNVLVADEQLRQAIKALEKAGLVELEGREALWLVDELDTKTVDWLAAQVAQDVQTTPRPAVSEEYHSLVRKSREVLVTDRRWAKLDEKQRDVYLAALRPGAVNFDPNEICRRLHKNPSGAQEVRNILTYGGDAVAYLISGAIEPSVLTLYESVFVYTVTRDWGGEPYRELLSWIVQHPVPGMDFTVIVKYAMARADFPDKLRDRYADVLTPRTIFNRR